MKKLLIIILIFQFSCKVDNVTNESACHGTTKVNYEGQVYNTVQIGDQCWLKENLNVGSMIPNEQKMSNNEIIEKYCYADRADSCAKFGGLYNWNEMMQYGHQEGVQGICPSGWHIPTDEEWKVLEGTVDSRFGIGDPEWDIDGEIHGFDAGKSLKSKDSWCNSNSIGTDLYGFSGLPGGALSTGGSWFIDYSVEGYWWTSTQGSEDNAWIHWLDYEHPGVGRNSDPKREGYSVRCIKDE